MTKQELKNLMNRTTNSVLKSIKLQSRLDNVLINIGVDIDNADLCDKLFYDGISNNEWGKHEMEHLIKYIEEELKYKWGKKSEEKY